MAPTPKLQAKHPRRITNLLTIALLLGSAGLIAGGLWLSFEAIFKPDTVVWLNQMLPEWAQFPTINQEPPQTLTQIRQQLRQMGKTAGEPVSLEDSAQVKSLVLPILSSTECDTDCNQITELRVYQLVSGQGEQQSYQLVNQLAIQGPEESFAIAPVLNAESGYRGSSQPLPVTELHQFEGTTPNHGVWLYLQGQTVHRGKAIIYGYVLHYNPEHSHLSLVLPWTSPTGQIPQWQRVTTSSPLELVIDRTVDLEPQLTIYQVKPTESFLNPVQLEPISLATPALKSPDYQDALLIARSGLWSPAWKWLQYIKEQQKTHWSMAAQVQMDLIQLSAQRTQAQAEQTWANPTQQVMADLIDGRWEKALQVFLTSPEKTREIATVLKTDSGQIWHRVEAALQVNPQRAEVAAWGALIVAAQEGQRKAISWLQSQPEITPATIAEIEPLLKRLDGDFSTTSNLFKNNISRFLGDVKLLAQVNPSEWLVPDQKALELKQQYWYQIQVTTLYDGKRWQRSPFTDLEVLATVNTKNITPLWHQLGLDTDPQIQIVNWRLDGQVTTTATIKAVQLHSGRIQLLASTTEPIATADSSSPLALTPTTLQWVQPEQTTLAGLSQEQPEVVQTILPVLWRSLGNRSSDPNSEEIQELGNLTVQLIDLTGNGQSEIVITLLPQTAATLNQSNDTVNYPRTIIFSPTGSLMYSEFNTASSQSVKAIADLQDGAPPALLVAANHTYSLQRWSAQRRRFD